MNELQVFTNTEFGFVRTCSMDGKPYFVGKDVAEILGYSNTRDALAKHVDEEDRGVAKFDTLGGMQEFAVINESGLFSLILRSQLPKAKQFKRWVTSEVLPSIRKHGVYTVDEMLKDPDVLISVLTELKKVREEKARLILESAMQKQQLAELRHNVSYYDEILQNKNTVPVTQIAKDYGMSGRKFNTLLHDLGVQYKLRSTWLLYPEYAECGYTKSRTFPTEDGLRVMRTSWTQKGRLFLRELLRDNGVLPVIEMEACA